MSATLRATLAAAAAVALLPLLPAAPAWAHATLRKTDPADGAIVATPVSAVTFTFNEQVKQQFSTIVVTGADGASYGDGGPHAAGTSLIQPVKPLPAGPVKVAWRTVSADGHPIEGQFTFTNAVTGPSGPAAAPSAIVAEASAATTVAADPAAGDGGPNGVLLAVAGGAVVVLLLGGALGWRRKSGAGHSG